MTYKLLLVMSVLGTAALSWSCGSDDDEELPSVDCATGAVPTFSEVTAFASCTSCHSSASTGAARNDAPVGIDFDVYESARTHAEHAAEEVNEGAMPPSGYPQPSDAAKEALYKWSLCGTPE